MKKRLIFLKKAGRLFREFFSDIINEFLKSVEFDFIHLLHHLPKFAFREALLFEPNIIIFGDINQVKVFVFAKWHFVMGEFYEDFRFKVQGCGNVWNLAITQFGRWPRVVLRPDSHRDWCFQFFHFSNFSSSLLINTCHSASFSLFWEWLVSLS